MRVGEDREARHCLAGDGQEKAETARTSSSISRDVSSLSRRLSTVSVGAVALVVRLACDCEVRMREAIACTMTGRDE